MYKIQCIETRVLDLILVSHNPICLLNNLTSPKVWHIYDSEVQCWKLQCTFNLIGWVIYFAFSKRASNTCISRQRVSIQIWYVFNISKASSTELYFHQIPYLLFIHGWWNQAISAFLVLPVLAFYHITNFGILSYHYLWHFILSLSLAFYLITIFGILSYHYFWHFILSLSLAFYLHCFWHLEFQSGGDHLPDNVWKN